MTARRSGSRAAPAFAAGYGNDFREFIDIISLTMPNRIVFSAWFEHAPFAFWLIKHFRPRTLVELGTHYGFSYLTFCQAVQSLRLQTKCYAIDTWRGDPHADTYGPEVLKDLVEYHDARYSAFSRLIESTFDDAAAYFEDDSLDLLHIDGYHTYAAVRHDFDLWKQKLSSRGLVVLHDTNVREREFGVWELWSELKGEFPSFEFVHGHGLGILGVGGKLPVAIRGLLTASSDPELTSDIREAYARLGSAISNQWTLQDRDRENARLAQEHASINQELRNRDREKARLGQELQDRDRENARLSQELQNRDREKARLSQELQDRDREKARLGQELQDRDRENARLGEGHARLSRERERAYQEAVVARSHASELLATLRKQSSEADSLRVELAVARDRASKTEVELNDQAREAKRLNHELSGSQDRIRKLEATLAEHGTETTRLRSETARAHEETTKLTREASALRGELDAVHRRADAAADALHAQLAKTAALEARLTAAAAPIATRIKQRLVSIAPGLSEWAQRDEQLHAMFAWAWWTVTLQLYPKLKAHRACATLSASGLFDRNWYLERYPDIRERGVDPLVHYVNHGAAEGRDPNPLFDSDWYLERNADVRRAHANPLQHYVNHGAAEGRDPSPLFDAGRYLHQNPALKTNGINPLLHYLQALAGSGLGSDRKQAISVTADRGTVAPIRLVYVSGEWHTQGHHYRVLRHAEAARLSGVQVSWMKLDDVPERLAEISAADALILWRARWDDRVATAVATARTAGAKIVFDIDDLMVDPDLAQISIIDGIRTLGQTEKTIADHFADIRHTMHEADLCSTTTEELAWYMRTAGKTTFVLPNGYDNRALEASRLVVRRRRKQADDGVVRIGYASGSRTHQRDFAVAAGALARILRERPNCILVLFRPCLDIEEFAELRGLEDRIEWRDLVSLERLPEEMARFDINIAPLEVGNPFCEAKSELKYFEAALVDAVTVASPTGPFRRAIRNGETGFLADDERAWHDALLRLIDDPALRRRVARAAKHDAMSKFGPMRRVRALHSFIAQLGGGPEAACAFALHAGRSRDLETPLPRVPETEIVFESDHGLEAEISVIVPLYNYQQYIIEALESVRNQTIDTLDLIVIDDRSTDNSFAIALDWTKRNSGRFNRLLVMRNRSNSKLGPTRNVGFDAAETPYVLPLDADNRLLPGCCERMLAVLRDTDIAFAYPIIKKFDGDETILAGNVPYDPMRLVAANYIDAMALIAKEAWVSVGGYQNVQFGWEDYDFWCRCAELGLRGIGVKDTLAEYRVHALSMLRTTTDRPQNKRLLLEDMKKRHPWLALVDREATAFALSDHRLNKTAKATKPIQSADTVNAEATGQAGAPEARQPPWHR